MEWTYDYDERETIGEAISDALEAVHKLPERIKLQPTMLHALAFLELEMKAATFDVTAELMRESAELAQTCRVLAGMAA